MLSVRFWLVQVGLKSHGEMLFAETQTYDGWIRLVDGGWVPWGNLNAVGFPEKIPDG